MGFGTITLDCVAVIVGSIRLVGQRADVVEDIDRSGDAQRRAHLFEHVVLWKAVEGNGIVSSGLP